MGSFTCMASLTCMASAWRGSPAWSVLQVKNIDPNKAQIAALKQQLQSMHQEMLVPPVSSQLP